jgi:hypothetical protein
MRLGLTSAVPHPRSLTLGTALPLAAIRVPAACDWQSALNLGADVPPDALGNDSAPCCVEAGYLRQAQMREAAAEGSGWKPRAAQAIGLLNKWGNPATGTDLAAAQLAAARDGIDLGPDLDVPLPVAVATDWPAIKAAIYVYGSAGLCWNLPAFVQDNPGGTWDVAPAGTAGTEPGSLGLHYTGAGAFDAGGVRVISWGLEPVVTEAFAALYLVGAAAQLSRRWFTARGTTLGGFDFAQIDALRRPFGG